jgi:hypothetical protein
VSGLRSVSNLADPTRSLFRFQVAAVLTALALTFAFIAVKFQTETYLSANPESRSPQSYSRIWFNRQDILSGAAVEGGVLRIHRLPGKNSSFGRNWELPIGSADHWTVATDLSYAAWTERTTLYARSLTDETKYSTIQLPVKLPMGVSILPDASVAVVFSDASVGRWDLNTGRSLGELRLPGLDTADRAAVLDDYVAVASNPVNTVALFRLRNGAWASLESIPAPEPPYQPAIPAAGTLATVASGHLRTGIRSRNTPGAVSSVVSFHGVIVVAGDFEKIWALSDYQQGQPEDDYEIAPAPGNSVLAVGRDHLAISGPQGTSILTASIDQRLTSSGRFTALLAFLQLIGALLLLMAPMLFRILLAYLASLAEKRGKRQSAGLIPDVLPDPPRELAELLAGGKGVLWAGAGLSAQSGVPLRHAFATSLLQTAKLEGWIEIGVWNKLNRHLSRGDVEGALQPLLESLLSSKFASYAEAVIPHYITPSHSHELLAKLPFTAAFTTNYDDLLSRLEVPWNSTCLTARGENVERAVNTPFLLKWYGNLKQYRTVLMTRPQLAAAAAESRASHLLQRILSGRSLLFVGASLEGIKADLEALQVPKLRMGRHYVVTGVSDPAWKGLATELSEHYGIEALVCAERNIGLELPKFLEKLVDQVNFSARPWAAAPGRPTPLATSHTEPAPHPVHK